jgi:hypothetical protein
MKTNALLIFTVILNRKARLAKQLVTKRSLTVYKDLLLHTRNETQAIDCDKFVFYDLKL